MAAALVGAAAVGAGVVALRHGRRSDGSGAPASRPPRNTASTRRGRRRSAPRGDLARVALIGRLTLHALDELGYAGLRLLTCRESADGVTLLVACLPGDAEAVTGARFTLGRRLGCMANARLVTDRHVELTIRHLRREATALLEGGMPERVMLLVPVGADETAVHYLDLGGAAQVALIGTPVETAGLLRSWLATLAAGEATESFGLAVASARPDLATLVEETGLPRWPGDVADGGEATAAALERELARRYAGVESPAGMPLMVAIVDGDAGDDPGRLETFLRRGPRGRIVPVVVRSTPEPADGPDELGAMCEVRIACAGATSGEPGTLDLVVADQPPVTLRPVVVPNGAESPVNRAAGTEEENPAAADETTTTADTAAPFVRDGTVGAHDAAEQPDRTAWHRPTTAPMSRNGASPVVPTAVEIIAAGSPGRREADASPAAAEPVGVVDASPAAVRPRDMTTEDDKEGEDEDDEGGRTLHTAADAEPRFTVRCLGTFEVELNGAPLAHWRSQKARELLAFLIAHGDVAVPREEAWSALWPELGAGRMQPMLSGAAFHLRRTLRDAAQQPDLQPLITQDGRYRLRPALFRIDLTNFDVRLRRAANETGVDALIAYERALALYRGRLFGTEAFDWAGGRRQEYEKRFLAAAHTAARLALQYRDRPRAIRLYQFILSREPLDEEAARGLMTCHAGQGDVTGVRKAYKALVDAIRREFDDPQAEPLPETTVLLRELTQGH